MERTQVLFLPEQKAKARALAERLGVSASEVYRLALEAFDPDATGDDAALELLLSSLRDGTERAQKALAEAEREVAETLRALRPVGDRR
jgi:hypothetical protein